MLEEILKILEENEKEYIQREREFPCKYYHGRADAYREMWDIVANMETYSNPYKQYEQIKTAISRSNIPSAQYEQLIQKIADILGI